MPLKTPSKIYFPNLDGIRFIAFFAVFIHHSLLVDFFSTNLDSALYKFVFAQKINGALGVNLFFVLSGFLISYLLLSEKKRFSTIHVGNFYLRRVLRIWPLYFTMVIIGFFIFPLIKTAINMVPDEAHSIQYYGVFLSNFEIIRKGNADSSILNVLWSVGVEEQFYLLWPLLLLIIPFRHLLKTFFALLIATLIFRYYHLDKPYILNYHSFAVFSDMIIGGVAAYFSFFSSAFTNRIKHLPKLLILSIYIIAGCIIIFNYLIFTNAAMIMIERLLYALFFAFVILEQNFSDHSFYKFSNSRFLSKWGNYTYGLYCLHTVGLISAGILTKNILHLDDPLSTMIVSFTFGLGLTMLLAYFSYHYLEAPFLKLKKRFAYFIKE